MDKELAERAAACIEDHASQVCWERCGGRWPHCDTAPAHSYCAMDSTFAVLEELRAIYQR